MPHTMTNYPDELDKLLHAVTAPISFGGLTPVGSGVNLKFFVESASLIRDRFSLGDLLVFRNWDPEK